MNDKPLADMTDDEMEAVAHDAFWDVWNEAAASRLQADRDALAAQLAALTCDHCGEALGAEAWCHTCVQKLEWELETARSSAAAATDALAAKVARYEDALRDVLNEVEDPRRVYELDTDADRLDSVARVARAALEDTP